MTDRDYLNDLEQMILLAVLSLGDSAYGGSVRRHLEETISRSIGRGALYTAIDRLVERGALETRLGESMPGRGGRPKRHLSLTPRGLEALERSRRVWQRLWRHAEGLGEAGT